MLGDGTATAARVLDAIDGARVVHFAAHGTFRADSPLFSALRLDDGPLTVYDLERLYRGARAGGAVKLQLRRRRTGWC